MSSGWRWWFRRKCCEMLEFEPFDGGVNIRICGRHRFHWGDCR